MDFDGHYSDSEIEQLLNKTSESVQGFEEIINKVRQYDIYDFLRRLAVLNCLPKNQNKEVLISGLIEAILSHPESYYQSSILMSHNRFQQIVKETEQSSLMNFIDPPEGPVIQNVIWNGMIFSCFPGMDKDSVFRLQQVIKVLESQEKLNNAFMIEASHILYLSLKTQNQIAHKLCLPDGYYEEENSKIIHTKSKKVIDDLENSIRIKLNPTQKEHFKELLGTITCKFGLDKTCDIDNYSFYEYPFLVDKTNEYIIPLDIGILSEFTFKYIMKLAEKHSVQGLIVEDYNKRIISNCCNYLNILGHVETHPELTKEDNLSKEMVFKAFESEYLIVEFIKENLDSVSHKDLMRIEEGEKCIELSKQLININDKQKSFNYIIIFNTSSLSHSCLSFNPTSLYGNSTALKPFELKCIAINEKGSEDFIPRFSNSFSKINCPMIAIEHTLDIISYYKESDYSFYRNDLDSRKAMMFFDYGISRGYVSKAVIDSSPMILPYYQRNIYVSVLPKDSHRNIYCFLHDKRIEECVAINSFCIWFISHDISTDIEEIVYRTIIDVLSYWIGENSTQLKPYFPFAGAIPVRIKAIDDDNEFIYGSTEQTDEDYPVIIDQNTITLRIAAVHFRQLSCSDNSQEKKLFIQTMDAVFSILGISPSIYYTAFSNPNKKLVASSNITDKLYLKPVDYSFNHGRIHEDDINIILDEIGDYISSRFHRRAFVGKDECISLIDSIISFLYSELASLLEKNNQLSVLYLAYADMEYAIFKTRSTEQRLINDLACYPERTDYYLKEASESNRLSLTIKCLIEFLSARDGSKTDHYLDISRKDYELSLAISNLIITWGRTRDAMYNGLIKNEIEILPSGRVGIDYSEFDYFSRKTNEFKSTEFPSNTKEPSFLSMHYDELESAYKTDYGYSLSEKMSVLQIISNYQIDNKLVHSCKKNELISLVHNQNHDITMTTIQMIIEDSILREREDFFSPPTGFALRDILPWKFTRQYSFIRRPIIQKADTLYWGSRNVNFLAHEELGLIYNCKLRTNQKSRVNKIQGKIAEDKSHFFNDSIFKKLSGYQDFLVKKNVKKDSQGKRLTDENHNDLGDIDVLAVDTRYKIIYVIEVKNYQFSRNNPDEIFSELQKMKEYHEKHIRRVHWICGHIKDVYSLFDIDEKIEFRIKEAMVTKAPVLAKHLLDRSINIIAEYELTEKKLYTLPTVKQRTD